MVAKTLSKRDESAVSSSGLAAAEERVASDTIGREENEVDIVKDS